eukprot:GHVN01107179.1.p1 GENE.GHVN01107179.1~~GHVN01107179.1.p1  ORF type:complete len:287 (+),score=64.00 GHVN01107179.1:538-1398(+)
MSEGDDDGKVKRADGVHSVISDLTQNQIDFFHREGYLSIPAITDSEDVGFCRRAYDRIFTHQAGREVGDQFDLGGTDEGDGTNASIPQILGPHKYAPELLESRLLKNVDRLAKQLMGHDTTTKIGHAIFKPPRTAPPTPWHQDAAYWDPNLIYRSMSVWVPLQEATLENGCMHFVPGSQKLDVVTHRSINNDPRIHGLELSQDEMHHVVNPVACPLPAGGATFHSPYTLHYTPANTSLTPRRALVFNCDLRPTERAEKRSYIWEENKRTARSERAKVKSELSPSKD